MNEAHDNTSGNELLRINEVFRLTKLSRATIWNKLNSDSKYYDASFPRQIKISKRAVAWLKRDIDNWINSLSESQ